MVKTCCVKNCAFHKLKHHEKISLHRFPVGDDNLLTRWIDFLGYGNAWKPAKHSCLCSLHFKPTDFRINTNIPRLQPDAVPTLKVYDIDPKSSLDDQQIVPEAEIEISHEELVNEDDGLALSGELDKTCGLCGKEHKIKLKNIFGNTKLFKRKVFLCLSSYLHINKHWTSVCSCCFVKLKEFEKFMLIIEQTQKKLSRRLQKMEAANSLDIVQPEICTNTENPIILQYPTHQMPTMINESKPVITMNLQNDPTNTVMQTFMIPLGDLFIPNPEFYQNIKMSIGSASDITLQTPQDPKICNNPSISINKQPLITESKKNLPSDESNKKITILQDIKIEPQQFLVNPTTEGSLLKKSIQLIKDEKMLIDKSTDSNKVPFSASCGKCKNAFTREAELNSHLSKCFLLNNLPSEINELNTNLIKVPKKTNINIMKNTTIRKVSKNMSTNISKSVTAKVSKKNKLLQDKKIVIPQPIIFKTSSVKLSKKLMSSEKIKSSNAIKHKNMDISKRPWLSNSSLICNHCGDVFISKYALNNHSKYLCRIVNYENSASASCSNCTKSFSSNTELNSHIFKCHNLSNSSNTINKHKRKPNTVMKRKIINNRSYMVKYDVKTKTR